MNKKRSFMVMMVLVIGIMLFWVPGIHARVITLTYANFPPASTFPCVQMERWKREVEKRTHHQVKVVTFPGGTLLGARDMFRGVIQGQADIGCLCMAYQPGVFPVTTAVGLPLGFQNATVASLVLWDLFNKYKPREFAKVKVLTLFTSAPSNIMSKVPVRSLHDLKGLELRASGPASKILDALGAIPVSMPMSETPEALQKGIVKGLLSSLEVLKDLNFAAYCPYETITNFQVYPFAVVMNRQKWDSLPMEVKRVLDSLSRDQAKWTGEYMDAHVRDAIAYAQRKYHVKIFHLSSRELHRAKLRCRKVIYEWKEMASRRGINVDKILQAIETFKHRYQR